MNYNAVEQPGPMRTDKDPVIDKFNMLVRVASDPASRSTPEGETAGRALAALIKNNGLAVTREATQPPTEVFAAAVAAIPEVVRLTLENRDLRGELLRYSTEVLRRTVENEQLRQQLVSARSSDSTRKIKAMTHEMLDAADEWLTGQAEHTLIPLIKQLTSAMLDRNSTTRKSQFVNAILEAAGGIRGPHDRDDTVCHKVIALFEEEPEQPGAARIAKKLGLRAADVRRYLAACISIGNIEAIGNGRNRRYRRVTETRPDSGQE